MTELENLKGSDSLGSVKCSDKMEIPVPSSSHFQSNNNNFNDPRSLPISRTSSLKGSGHEDEDNQGFNRNDNDSIVNSSDEKKEIKLTCERCKKVLSQLFYFVF